MHVLPASHPEMGAASYEEDMDPLQFLVLVSSNPASAGA